MLWWRRFVQGDDSQTVPKSLISVSEACLKILDQRALPGAVQYIDCVNVDEVIEAIGCLAVRGAPAIGLSAAFGLTLDLDGQPENADKILLELQARGDRLIASRPTAVNLAWAVEQMLHYARSSACQLGGTGWRQRLYAQAQSLFEADREACRKIGEAGVALLEGRKNILTHCNAGALAVSEYGTALAPIYVAKARGQSINVWVDETRPLLQGARLTAFELMAHDVSCQLITDNMAAHVMASGQVDLVLVGADRVAANGDAANKIGTLGLAVLAHHYGIPFVVACPWSTIDLETRSGSDIVIEERDSNEVCSFQGVRSAPDGMNAFNPAFDVTPADLITALVTERGVLRAPFSVGLKAALAAG